jgi:hypothetical protein
MLHPLPATHIYVDLPQLGGDFLHIDHETARALVCGSRGAESDGRLRCRIAAHCVQRPLVLGQKHGKQWLLGHCS